MNEGNKQEVLRLFKEYKAKVEQDLQNLEQLLRLKLDEINNQDSVAEEGDINYASKLTGYKKGTIHQYVHRGEIPYTKHGRKLWFKKRDLIKWLNERQYI